MIVGRNAQGKTNLLEAISLVTTGRSFRTDRWNELVLDGELFFFLEAELVKDGVVHTVAMSWQKQEKKLRINTTEFKTFSPLLGAFPFVISAPDDTLLITDEPSFRRRFLNLHLAQKNPLYVHHFSRFWNAMQQRNVLLKMQKEEGIECWEEQMAHSAEFIDQAREDFLKNLHLPLSQKHDLLAVQKEEVQIRLHTSYPASKSLYAQHLKKMRHKEKEVGTTLYGPHRDDVIFSLQSKPAKLFASEGQKKTLVTALRLAQWEDLADSIGDSPFFAIDDFGSALDGFRQEALKQMLMKMGQVFISMPLQDPRFSDAHQIEISCPF